jgi:lauroyl/myristoyl acyltransferase
MRKTYSLAEWMGRVLASWRMKTTTNHPQNAVIPVPCTRQEMLDLNGAGRWQELPESDRDACLQALAQLLYQTITRQPEGDENE